jgi:hypothetical protein
MTSTAILQLKGPLTIRTAVETRDSLIAFLNDNPGPGNFLTVAVDSDAECDLTLPQLLISACKTAASADTKLKLQTPASGNFLAVINRAGLLTGEAEQDGFWLEGQAA